MATRRPPRLPRGVYIGTNRYSVTVHAFPGSRPFLSRECVVRVMRQFRQLAARHHFAVLAFCFMRDHLHLVLEGTDDTADLVRFISLFKQHSGFEHRRETSEHLWQEGFYDRVLRADEDSLDAVRYVLSNPVRAGLAQSIVDWPFSGSDVFDIRYLD